MKLEKKLIYIAHRGLYNKDVPENSLEAFRRALLKGYAIELDVRMTKDEKIVVFHDSNTKRMTGIDKNVEESTYLELQELNLGDSKEKICLLEDVLLCVQGKVYLDIEIKNTKKIKLIVKKLVAILDGYTGLYSLKSFNPLIVRFYKKLRPDSICGVLCCHFKSVFPKVMRNVLTNCQYFFLYKPDFVAYKLTDYNKKIEFKLKQYGVPVMLWTIRNLDDLDQALGLSNYIIFDSFDFKQKKN